MLAKDRAKRMREELKERGLGNKEVSVRTNRGGYDTSVSVVIKDINVDFNQVKNVVSVWEKIQFDHNGSGEILGGGNIFVNVSYDSEVIKEAGKQYKEIAKKILEDNKDLKEGSGVVIAENGEGKEIGLWKDVYTGMMSISLQEVEGYTVNTLDEYSAYNENVMAEGLALMVKQNNMKFI